MSNPSTKYRDTYSGAGVISDSWASSGCRDINDLRGLDSWHTACIAILMEVMETKRTIALPANSDPIWLLGHGMVELLWDYLVAELRRSV